MCTGRADRLQRDAEGLHRHARKGGEADRSISTTTTSSSTSALACRTSKRRERRCGLSSAFASSSRAVRPCATARGAFSSIVVVVLVLSVVPLVIQSPMHHRAIISHMHTCRRTGPPPSYRTPCCPPQPLLRARFLSIHFPTPVSLSSLGSCGAQGMAHVGMPG